MSKRIHIVEQYSPYRLVECAGHGHAVVEFCNGRVYSMHCMSRREADDSKTGMFSVVDPDGWSSEREARDRFHQLIESGEHLARKIW